MTGVDVGVGLLKFIVYFLFYFFTAFGSGFVVGVLLANMFKGRGNPSYMQLYRDSGKAAAEHNAQWNPTNERWNRS